MNKLPLKSLFRLDMTSCLPASQPEQAFLHHSIPAWDESGGPVVELGNTIGSNKFLISHACVLVSKLNPRKSRVSVVRDLHGEFPQCASTEFMVYVPIHEDADIGFYSWYMKSECFQSELERVATGTTNSHVRVTPKETLNWKIAHPPLPEQRRIAEILDTIDEAIQKTEALISKLKAMKQGLLHDLLTSGLDKNGKLRDPKAHLEQFKDSPLGRIPREWDIGRIDQFLNPTDGIKPGPFGSSITKIMYTPEGYKVYGQEQVIAGDLTVGDYYISTDKFNELRTFEIHENDILMSLVGTVGRVLVVRSPFRQGIINPRLIRFRPVLSKGNPIFLRELLMSDIVKRQLASLFQGGTMPVLSATIIRKLILAKPKQYEQEMIAKVLMTHDARIRTEEQYRDKLKLQKKGLMHDLLTGKVRVKV